MGRDSVVNHRDGQHTAGRATMAEFPGAATVPNFPGERTVLEATMFEQEQ